jgi:hypothetical protein
MSTGSYDPLDHATFTPEPGQTIPSSSACWPVDMGCGDWTPYDAAQVERAVNLAGSSMRMLTANRVGGCPVTVRPCTNRCGDNYGLALPYGPLLAPMNLNGQWVNGCGCKARRCSCSVLSYVALNGPVGKITDVWVDGVQLAPTDYFLMDGNHLVRIGDTWPACQDLTVGPQDPGGFSVTYQPGFEVDSSGAWAAGILALEFAKACAGSKCELPKSVTQVTRSGITYTLPTGAFPDGKTGIRVVDAYIAQWNPHGLKTAPTVWSPDSNEPVHRR